MNALNAPQAVISPDVPQPDRLPSGHEPYPTMRGGQAPAAVIAPGAVRLNVIDVTQGLARLLSFKKNIISVFFSDINVMDARAVNARTVAVTGLAPGTSTLAVFTERFEGIDAIGKVDIYNISVRAQGATVRLIAIDPDSLASSVRVALDDPRIGVSTVQSPDGTVAVTSPERCAIRLKSMPRATPLSFSLRTSFPA